MKTLIITEKPKVSQRIAYSLSNKSQKKRYGRVPYYYVKENEDEIYIASAAGHLYSLKQEGEGYDYPVFEISWQPLHTIDKSKYYVKGYIDVLKRLGGDVDRFIIATDWDIEGELLGFNALRFSAEGSDAKRMRFSTLVSNDLRKAYEKLDEIDRGLVDAGEARHIMDWYWGINISRALMHATRMTGGKFSISAGRVQTPALSVLVRREREIKNFKPEKFYEILAHLKFKNAKIKARHRDGRFKEKDEAQKALNEANVKEAEVTSVDISEVKRYPFPPFDLGELQSEAYRVFRFNPKRTQGIAQSLYESGLISYPRTSSQKYPPSIGYRRLIKALSGIKGFEKGSKLLEKEKLYPRQGKKDDPAHPAIFPTGLSPKSLTPEEEKLYSLIIHRFFSVFADPALLGSTVVDLLLGTQPFYYETLEIKSEGLFEFYPYSKIEEKLFPGVTEKDKLTVQKLEMKEGLTKAPSRYNPASLIRKLEEKSLGTKATRAETVDTLYKRNYIKGSSIQVTDAGVAVIESLENFVPEIVDEELTRRFEDYIEKIRVREKDKDMVLSEARNELTRIITEFKKHEKEIGETLTREFAKTRSREQTVGKCPDCEGELRILKSPRTGKSFIGCSNYPKCKTSYPVAQRAKVSPSDKACGECGLPMVRINFGRKAILSCIDFNCKSKQKK
jgi:DNA topoisomerase-1